MRDASAFRERFKQWKTTGELPYEAGLPKYDTGKDDKVVLNKQQKEAVDYIYKTLKQAGWDDMSIAGALGNGKLESDFIHNVTSKAGYNGIWQNSKGVYNSVVGLYGDHSLKSQTDYIIDWANNNKKIRAEKYSPYLATYAGKYKKTGYKTPEDAADAFMKMYERPVILDNKGKVIGYQSAGARKKYAKQMYDYIQDEYTPKIFTKEDSQQITPLTDIVEDRPRFSPSEIAEETPTYIPFYHDPDVPSSINRASSSYSGGYSFTPLIRLSPLLDYLHSQNQELQQVVNPSFKVSQ